MISAIGFSLCAIPQEKNILILAYGISETNEPNQKWDIENPITIAEYFKDNDLGTPARYGKSYVFKVYNLETTKLTTISTVT